MRPGDMLVISLLLVSAFVVILNETIMGVALPRLMADLDITAATAQWLTTAFLLTMAIVIPITGFLLQRFHVRPVFITAMTLFSIGTAIAASAPGFELLLLGRIVQASGTAIMMPLLITTVMTLVPEHQRGRMMGNISIVISVAPAIGPTVSGLILSSFSWRWMFLLVLPFSIGALVLGMAKVRNVTTPRSLPIDALSVVLSAFAFGGLIYGISSIGEAAAGHTPVAPWIPIVVGVGALALFVRRQLLLQRTDTALLDLRTFTSRTFSISIVLVGISMMALFGMIIVLPLYLQNVRGLDTLDTGLLLLPGGVVMGLLAPVVGRLYDRFGPTPLVMPGAALVCLVMGAMTQLDESTPLVFIPIGHTVLSIGLAVMFTPLLTSALGAVRPSLYSHASAIVGTSQQLAGAVGTALFVTIMTRGTTSALDGGASDTDALVDGIQAAFMCRAVISLIAVAVSLLVRRQPAVAGAAPVPAH